MSPDAAINLEQWNARRRRAVELRLQGKSIPIIRQETGLSAPTIIAAHRAYVASGWNAVPIMARGRKPGAGRALQAAQEEVIRCALRESPQATGVAAFAWNLAHASQWIDERFGMTLEARTLARYLSRWGFALGSWRSAAQASEAGTRWWAETLPRLTKQARDRAALVVWCCVSEGPTTEPTGSATTLYRAQTMKGRLAWRCDPGVPSIEGAVRFLEELSVQLGTPLCAAVSLPPDADASIAISHDHLSLWPCLVQPPAQRVAAQQDDITFAASTATVITESITPPAAPIAAPFRPATERTISMNHKLTHLQRLEAESIHIFREVVAECEKPVMLYSIGKDSSVMLHLARKAFYPAPPPFPLLHVDTTWKFRDMYAMRERMAAELDMQLLVHQNPEAIELDVNPFVHGSQIHTDMWKTQGLKQALDKYGFDAAFGGARRDEEKSRAKERIFSFRSAQHRWDPKNQRPELWNLYNSRMNKGESIRVFPISNWTELDVWQYIHLENIPIVPLYFAKERPVVERDGSLIMVDDHRMPLRTGETPMMRHVRFRTLGCYPLTGAVESKAQTLPEIIQEMLLTRTSERQGRVIDHDVSASMEKKKQEGYF